MRPGLDLAQVGGRPQSCQAGPSASSQPWALVREEHALLLEGSVQAASSALQAHFSLVLDPAPSGQISLVLGFLNKVVSVQGGSTEGSPEGQEERWAGEEWAQPLDRAPAGHVGPRHRADGHARAGVGGWAQTSHAICWSGRPGSAQPLDPRCCSPMPSMKAGYSRSVRRGSGSSRK